MFTNYLLFLYSAVYSRHIFFFVFFMRETVFSNIPQSGTYNSFSRTRKRRERERTGTMEKLCANRKNKFLKKRPGQFEWRAFKPSPNTRQHTRTHILSHTKILKNVKQNGLKTYNV